LKSLKYLIILFCLVFSKITLGQQKECATTISHQKHLKDSPEFKTKFLENEDKINKILAGAKKGRSINVPVYTIPLVVHVLEPSTGSTIMTDTEINAMIVRLNNVYRAIGNYSGSNDFFIQFELAKRSPSCTATTGIVRYNASASALYVANGITSSGSTGINELVAKAWSKWPNDSYYNLWVVNKIDGADGTTGLYTAGFAYYPGASADRDGAILLANSLKSPTSIVLPHEIGHALNIRHTFALNSGGDAPSGTCPSNVSPLIDGDACADTDPMHGGGVFLGSNCTTAGTITNPCTAAPYGVLVNNIMNYQFENCQIKFTPNQVSRARATLESSRASLLSSRALEPPATPAATACIPTGTTLQNYFGITVFNFNSLLVKTSSVAGIDGYFYKDNACFSIINITAGSTNPVTVETAANQNYVKVYIDYDNNGVFNSTNELVSSGLSVASGTQYVYNFSYVAPTTGFLANQELRLRVVCDPASTLNSCTLPGLSGFGSGQAEDYTIKIQPLCTPPTLSISGTTNIDCANPNVVRTAVGTGTYLWSNALGTTAAVNISTAGTYTVTLTTTGGCTATATTIVAANTTPPVATIAGTANITCSIPTVTRTASGGGTYLWSNALGTTATVNITTAGTYTVTVTAANGCTATATTIVTANTTPPVATISGTANITCSIPTVMRTASGGGTYLWSNTLGTTAAVNISAAGTYTVTVTAANGCTATATTLVTANTTPPVAAITGTANITCSIPTVTRTASGGGTYLWSNTLGTTAAVNISAAGTYTVTVTAANGCTATATTVVTANTTPPVVVITGTTNIDCLNSSVTRTASSGGTYLWSNALGTTAAVNISAAGTYTVTVTAANGCTATATTIVAANTTPPVATIAGTANITCSIPTVTRTASGGGTYLWSNALGTTATVNITTAGTYTLTVTAANGCTATATTIVAANTTPPVATIAGTANITCSIPTVTRTASGGGTYLWSNALGTTAAVNISAAGTYTVTVTAANGCTATATTVVAANTTPPVATIAGTANITCSIPTVTRTASGGGTYLWSNALGTTATVNITAAGTYTVTVTAANGCTATATTVVTANTTPPVVVITGTTNIDCLNPSVTRTANGGGTYLWSNALGTTATVNISAAGTYTVTVTAANGCTATATTVVTANTTPPVVVITGTTNIDCLNPSVTRTANGGGTYLWSNALGTTATVNISAAGTYTVTVTAANGCVANVATIVTQIALPSSPIVNSPIVELNTSATLTASGCSGTVNWYDANISGNLLFSGTTFTTNILTTNTTFYADCILNGCTSLTRSASIVTINPCPNQINLSNPLNNLSNVTRVFTTSKNVINTNPGQINATNIITGGNITYDSGKNIILSPGFSVSAGSVFLAQIGGCP
jgi:Ig-like domain CHU_C associated/Pregnancy-associated plasma protein-A/GEVED domain